MVEGGTWRVGRVAGKTCRLSLVRLTNIVCKELFLINKTNIEIQKGPFVID